MKKKYNYYYFYLILKLMYFKKNNHIHYKNYFKYLILMNKIKKI